jgi:hypothetical protein
MDERERIFQKAVETIDLASVPTLGGLTRKTDDIDRHIANGGKEGGPCITVQSARKTDYRVEQAYDLLNCLPEKRKGVALIFARYCQPWMLEDYPGLVEEIERAGLKAEREGWQGWTREIDGASGFYVGRFWKEAQRRRVLRAA